MMKTYKVVYGDPSDDGHGKSQTFHVKCNKDWQEVADLVQRIKVELEIDIAAWGQEYKDSEIPENVIKLCQGKVEEFCEDTENFWPELALDCSIFLLKSVDPTLKITRMHDSEMLELPIGCGYGFF